MADHAIVFRIHRDGERPHLTVHVDDDYEGDIPGAYLHGGDLIVSEGNLTALAGRSVYGWTPAQEVDSRG